MRRVSKKRARQDRVTEPLVRALKEEVGRCEICEPVRWRTYVDDLEVHEIARGTANRQKARGKRFASLVVCYWCHRRELSSAAKWPMARQLAVLKRSRPQDYDLAAFNRLRCRAAGAITEDEVNGALP